MIHIYRNESKERWYHWSWSTGIHAWWIGSLYITKLPKRYGGTK